VKKWVKVVLGCLVVVVLGFTCLGLGVSYGLFRVFSWGKAQVAGLAETEKQIEELQRQANANAFTRPADGRLSEDRLLKFLAVRRDIWGVYEKYKPQIEARKGDRQPTISDIRLVAQATNEIRLARARAQAREAMSDEEYGFHVEQVYKTAWASELQKGTGESGPVSETVGKGLEETEAGLRKQLQDPNLSPELRRMLEQQLEQLKQAGGTLREQARALDVPPENVALLRKHEAEIRKYTMEGLAFIGL
jgi:hypothetical protein